MSNATYFFYFNQRTDSTDSTKTRKSFDTTACGQKYCLQLYVPPMIVDATYSVTLVLPYVRLYVRLGAWSRSISQILEVADQ